MNIRCPRTDKIIEPMKHTANIATVQLNKEIREKQRGGDQRKREKRRGEEMGENGISRNSLMKIDKKKKTQNKEYEVNKIFRVKKER